MALPTKTDELTLDYGYAGTPYAEVTGSSSIDTTTLDYGFAGVPFTANPDTTAPTGPANLKSMFGVPVANIKTINGIAIANVKAAY